MEIETSSPDDEEAAAVGAARDAGPRRQLWEVLRIAREHIAREVADIEEEVASWNEAHPEAPIALPPLPKVPALPPMPAWEE